MAAKATTPDRPERKKGPGPGTRPVPGVARLEAVSIPVIGVGIVLQHLGLFPPIS